MWGELVVGRRRVKGEVKDGECGESRVESVLN